MNSENESTRLSTIVLPNGRAGISESDRIAAQGLVNARLQGRVLNDFPGELPTTFERAYAIQEAAIGLWPDDLVAWKVARLPPQDRGRLPMERLFGPAFRDFVEIVKPTTETKGCILDGGFAVIEAEIVFELAVGVPAETREWPDEDLERTIGRAFGGAEIASSPMPDVIERGAMAIIADLGINMGVIAGPEIPDFASMNSDPLVVTVSVDGQVVGEARPEPIAADPYVALRSLFNHCAVRGIELPQGALVSTGLLTGAHPVQTGSIARIDFGPLGWFDIRFEAFTRSGR